ncbi:hypothetical protein AAFC00_003081 [Neodothiora populina]|uniref:Signal recognition particle protein n=1 Tax=Neodothiora populina TaxID=2781224 RepID=A0ABR3P983_9PEZI
MSRNARIEEVSDSDSDPSDMDPSDFDPSNIMQSIMNPADVAAATAPSPQQSSAGQPFSSPMLQPHLSGRPPASQAADRERTKHYQCLYPIYFDSTRSRAEGRRVGKEQGVANPLAQDIAQAVSQMAVAGQVVFEPGKVHPKDWANPGRVRVLIKENGKPVGRGGIKNKHHLYNLVAEYLRDHPTTQESASRLRIAGLPPPTKPIPPPAAPKGWKMGTILPLHSPALSGGGVNENYLKDMMAEMQGQGGMPGMPGMPDLPPGMLGGGAGASDSGAPKKKDKKKTKS